MTFDEWVISRLRVHGAYAGAMDGVPGRAMVAGLKRFQTAEGLVASGLADQPTVNALRREGPARDLGSGVLFKNFGAGMELPPEPVWLREARRLQGIREVSGQGSNPTILGWAGKIGGWVRAYYSDDDIPWCGLFIAHVIGLTLPSEPLPANPLAALEWGKFGRGMPEPAPGAVLVFTRTGGGHVGLYEGEDRTHFHVLGGNQNNAVSITPIEKARLKAMRWPVGGAEPAAGRVQLSPLGKPMSRNEA